MKDLRFDRTNLVVALLCVLPYLGFWLYGLTDLDEGFYGAVVTDMIRRGDWVTPTYNGLPWFEKPILSYWLAIPFVSVFPANEFAARLPSFLCTMGTAYVLFQFAKRHFDLQAARLTALIYTSSLLVVAIGRMMMTDSALVLALTLAFTTFFDSLVDPNKQKLKLWTAFFLGIAVLAKGPVAIVLFGLLAFITHWRLKDLRPNFKGPWLLGTAILLGVVATWYVPAYLANQDTFIQEFLIEQNIGRFRGGDTAHTVPWYLNGIYFPIILALAMAPWLGSSIKAGWHNLKLGTGKPLQLRNYLWIWALVVAAFFTISKTKLPHYVLPALPALSLLAAEAIAHRHPARRPEKFWLTFAGIWAGLVFVLANVIFLDYHRKQFAEVQAMAKYAWQQKLPLTVLSLGRQSNEDPEIKLSLDSTSHPSILFYYQKPATLTDQLNLNPSEPTLIIARPTDPRLKSIPKENVVSPTEYGLKESKNYTLIKVP